MIFVFPPPKVELFHPNFTFLFLFHYSSSSPEKSPRPPPPVPPLPFSQKRVKNRIEVQNWFIRWEWPEKKKRKHKNVKCRPIWQMLPVQNEKKKKMKNNTTAYAFQGQQNANLHFFRRKDVFVEFFQPVSEGRVSRYCYCPSTTYSSRHTKLLSRLPDNLSKMINLCILFLCLTSFVVIIGLLSTPLLHHLFTTQTRGIVEVVV